MNFDSCSCPGQSTIIASTIAAALAQGLTADEAEELGSFLSLVGHALENTALQIAACERRKANMRTVKCDAGVDKNDDTALAEPQTI